MRGYKYQLVEGVALQTEVASEREISHPMMVLHTSGLLLIQSGYAWDGPSGPTLDTKSTMQASLAHDALYQLMREGLLSPEHKPEADRTLEMLGVQDGMWKWRAHLWERAVNADSAMNWDNIQNFKPAEFICHCGRCNGSTPGGVADLMDQDFITKLDWLRNDLGFPIGITSGYRCPDHNASVSSTGRDGPHTTGMAVDLDLNRERAFKILKHIEELGFMGLGVQQKDAGRFIHLDMARDTYAFWSY